MLFATSVAPQIYFMKLGKIGMERIVEEHVPGDLRGSMSTQKAREMRHKRGYNFFKSPQKLLFIFRLGSYIRKLVRRGLNTKFDSKRNSQCLAGLRDRADERDLRYLLFQRSFPPGL
jgi:hypothetical protein